MPEPDKKKGPPGATGMIPNDLPGGPPPDMPPDMPPPGPPPDDMMAPPGAGPTPMSEPYGAQVLRHFHQLKRQILQEFDQLLQTLENESVRSFLEQYLQFVEASLTKAEALFAKEYKEMEGLDGAMGMDSEAGPEPEKKKPSPNKDKDDKSKKPNNKEAPKKSDKKDDKKPVKKEKESEKVTAAKKKYLEARKEDILERLRARRKALGLKTKDYGATGTDTDGNGIITETESGSKEEETNRHSQILEEVMNLLSQIETEGSYPDRMAQQEASRLAGALGSSGSEKMIQDQPVIGKAVEFMNRVAKAGSNYSYKDCEEARCLKEEIQKFLTGTDKESGSTGDSDMEEMKDAAEATFNNEPGEVQEKRLEKVVQSQARTVTDLQAKLDRLSKLLV